MPVLTVFILRELPCVCLGESETGICLADLYGQCILRQIQSDCPRIVSVLGALTAGLS